MAKKNNDALKKHHFWILFLLVPLLVLVAVFTVSSNAGDKIDELQSAYDTAKSSIASKTNPKSNATIAEIEKLGERVGNKKGELQAAHWDMQKHLFTWPESPVLARRPNLGKADGMPVLVDVTQLAPESKEVLGDKPQFRSATLFQAGEETKEPRLLVEARVMVMEEGREVPKLVRVTLKGLPAEDADKITEGAIVALKYGDADQEVATYPYPKLEDLKFGDPLPNDRAQFAEFRKNEVYLAQFSTVGIPRAAGRKGMADLIAPTRFQGGWRANLRHVANWVDPIKSEEIWLAMEDIWVQRSLLSAITAVNAQIARFEKVEDKRLTVTIPAKGVGTQETTKDLDGVVFQSRLWKIELALDPTTKEVMGRLYNNTDRLLPIGLNNTMVLNVTFKIGDEVRPPIPLKIGGEFLAGKGGKKLDGTTPADVLDILPTQISDTQLPTTVGAEIVGIEQVFDTRTVPVRRIERLALGFRDSRYADKKLFPPAFLEDEAAAVAAPGTGGFGSPDGSPDGGFGGGPPTPGGVAGPGGGSPGGVGGTTGGGTALTNQALLSTTMKRYVVRTSAVRRMPVGIVLIVDQSNMQDALLALANTPLRFQITQVSWKRFRGSLNTTGAATGAGDPYDPSGDGDVEYSGYGNAGGGLELGGSGFGSPGVGSPGLPSGGPPIGGSPPGGPPIGGSPGGPPIGGSPGGPGIGLGSGYDPTRGSGLGTVSESQLTAGLVELSVYGVISIYEKFPPLGETVESSPPLEDEPAEPEDTDPKDDTGEKTDPMEKSDTKVDADPKTPTDKTPGKKTPMPETPMGTNPKAPKMRRRVVR